MGGGWGGGGGGGGGEGEGVWVKKCDLVRADCKNFALQEKVCILIRLLLEKS